MRAGHFWLASFAILPLVGAPLMTDRAFRRFGLACRVVLAGAVGTVVLSWTMTAFALVGVRWGPMTLFVSAAVVFALRFAVHGHPGKAPSPRSLEGQGEGRSSPSRAWGESRGRSVTTVAALAITAISFLAAFAAAAATRSTSPDLLLFWGPKAQQFAAARTIDAEFLSTPFLEYMHIYYPPLVTNVLAFGTMVAGRFPWGAVTLTFPLLLAAIAVGLSGILQTDGPRSAARTTTALAVSAISLIGIHASVAGNAEAFLLFFEMLALAILLTPASRSVAGQLLAGLLLAGAVTSKVEGLPFAVATVALFIAVEYRSARPLARTLLIILGPGIVALGTWFAFGAARNLFRGYRGYGEINAVHWESLPGILSAIGLGLWKTGYALPWLVPLSILLLTGLKVRRALLPVGVAILLAGFVVFTYVTTAGDPALLIGWSAARVFSPLAGLFALAAWCTQSQSQ
jgi:hypothetical protein